jgi:hypothetical protein
VDLEAYGQLGYCSRDYEGPRDTSGGRRVFKHDRHWCSCCTGEEAAIQPSARRHPMELWSAGMAAIGGLLPDQRRSVAAAGLALYK